MNKKLGVWIATFVLVIGAAVYLGAGYISARFFEVRRVNVLKADGAERFMLMDFSQPMALDPVPDGWHHRIFRSHEPMSMSLVEKDKKPSIRLETRNSASILTRFVDIPLDGYAALRWEWFIEVAITSSIDERTVEGDDHPARLFLKFEAADKQTHNMEIIWGNQTVGKGEWLRIKFYYVLEFPHYTANAGMDNVGRWHAESVDLRALYRTIAGDPKGARLIEIGLFADSDQTGGNSVAYFSNVAVEKQAP
jgi:hypothetical protein